MNGGDGSGVEAGGFDQFRRHHPGRPMPEERRTWEEMEFLTADAGVFVLIMPGADIA
jgi:hypothetical protein